VVAVVLVKLERIQQWGPSPLLFLSLLLHTSGWAGPGEYNNAGMCGGPLFPSQHHFSPSSSSQPSLGTSFTVIRECTQGICEKLDCKMPRGNCRKGNQEMTVRRIIKDEEITTSQ